MMTYTETGLALMAAAIEAGTQIQFKRVELIADPERSAGELVHETDIASVKKKDSTTIIVKAVTDNYNFTGDYYFNKINVYVCGADDQEILFCFQKSTTCPFYIPQYDGRPVQNEISIYITVASTDAVSIVNDGVYVLQTDFEERMLQKIDVAAIVQNATTAATDKVASAAVTKELQDQITTQNMNMKWKLHKSSVQAKALTDLPINFNELHIIVYLSSIAQVTYDFDLIKEELVSGSRSYTLGYGWIDGANQNACQLTIDKTQTRVSILRNAGVDYVDSALMDIYYR